MRSFVLRHGVLVGIALLAVGTAVYFVIDVITRDPLEGLTLATVEEGVVESIVSVSGITRSRNTAELAFPSSGIVAAVPVIEGDTVEAGTILATLGSSREAANLEKARAELAIAEAALQNLQSGTRSEARAVTAASVAAAREEIARARTVGDLAVANATRALYSGDLTARSTNPFEAAPAPVITGTYRCSAAGTYTLSVYNSGAESGFSMQVSGLETGTYSVGIDQATSFGSCGLFAQFADNETYHNTTWTIEIPNTGSANYTTLKNALDVAITNRTNTIAAATEALTIAERRQSLENASPLQTEIRTAEARVAQAKASLAELTSTLADRSIVAPFAGTVTTVDILPGETAPTTPVITLLAADAFEVIARIPEIDITKMAVGQTARILFDAEQTTVRTGTVNYIAPLPTLIDGVSYFEVKIMLSEIPTWLRGGLNADIDIITGQSELGAKVPSRYLSTNESGSSIRTLVGNEISTTSVTVSFTGNDGFVAIDGLTPGVTIVAP
jgi:multidrug efflux pump subunit AcrA (membrane-fusion protein)